MKGLVFTYLLLAGGLIAPLFSPFVGLLFYACFAVLRPQYVWSYSLPDSRFSLYTALALIVGWVIHGCGNWRFGRAKPIVWMLLVFAVWLGVSGLLAPNQEVAWAHVETLWKCLLPCLIAISLIDSVARLKQLAWLLVLCQGYWALEFNLQYVKGQIYPQDWHFASLDNNGLAILMATSVGLAFFLGMHSKALWQRGLAFTLAALMSHAVLFSMSRGGMLGLMLVGGVSFLIMPKRPRDYGIFLVACLVLARLAGPQVIEEFSTVFARSDARDDSAQSRLELTKAMLDAMAHHPLTGLGPRHWPQHAPEYGFKEGKEGHNTWAQVGAEIGVPGFLSLLGFYLICMARLWPLTRDSHPVSDPWLRYLARAVLASLTGFMVSASFVSVEAIELPYYVAIIGAGVIMLSDRLKVSAALPARPNRAVAYSMAWART